MSTAWRRDDAVVETSTGPASGRLLVGVLTPRDAEHPDRSRSDRLGHHHAAQLPASAILEGAASMRNTPAGLYRRLRVDAMGSAAVGAKPVDAADRDFGPGGLDR